MNGRTNVTIGVVGSIDFQIPLDPPSSFVAQASMGRVELSWIDPKNKYATPEGEQTEDTDQLVSVWSYTKVIRKEGSLPTNPDDGIIILTSTVYNQYQNTIYNDTSVENGKSYYYSVYAYNTDGTYSDPATSGEIIPYMYDAVLTNNTWKDINDACSLGLHTSFWEIGDIKNDPNGSNGIVDFTIVGFDLDDISDGSGKAAITFRTNQSLPNKSYWKYNSYSVSYVDSTPRSTIRNGNYLPTEVQSYVLTIKKISNGFGHWDIPTEEFSDKCFLFSLYELTGSSHPEDSNFIYPYFTTTANRIVYLNGSAVPYFTRTCFGKSNGTSSGPVTWNYYIINENGSVGNVGNTAYYDPDQQNHFGQSYIAFGFCIGKVAV